MSSRKSQDELLHNAEIERYVREWLQQLNDKQRTVIERRYGLNGYEICTLEELAASMSLTRERVRQIQIEGLETCAGCCGARASPKTCCSDLLLCLTPSRPPGFSARRAWRIWPGAIPG